VFRRGKHQDLNVTVAELETEQARGPGGRGNDIPPAATGALGLAVSDLSDTQRSELKVKGGVLVRSAEGSAARAGLREGDVILSVDNTEISSVKQFEAVVAKLDKNKPVNVLLRRGEWVSYVVIRPGR
jgi:serine protease Do